MLIKSNSKTHDYTTDSSFLYGFGLYETFRTYKNKLVFLEKHYNRLVNSLKTLNLPIPVTYDRFYKICDKFNKNTAGTNLRFRLTISFNEKLKPHLTLRVRKLIIPSEHEYETGVNIQTATLIRPQAEHKHTSMFEQMQLWRTQPKNTYEFLIGSDNQLFEGTKTNFFAVKNNVLIQPTGPQLPGIMQNIVLELANKNDIEVQKAEINPQNLADFDELFLTNSIIGILPIGSINNIALGNKHKLTKKLQQLLQEEIKRLS